MHAGPPPWTPRDSGPRPQSHGGESVSPSPVTTSRCTEVCGQGLKDNRDEIPTSEAALAHPHLQAIAPQIPPLDPSAEILLLLGRDIIQAHKVRSQVN
ncbi:hypothetical protein DPEC_G00244770 [Dallia pectoralis]|uniref:Uncharacterized protein n=1 Tax=Dallia pectoralis TaxID=75939 RepID=A0ACC2FVT6_DALPE|nr:hypothetical protein DPEC_G00244770 [Dallia pectoralis]